jgi:hypothetical protein
VHWGPASDTRRDIRARPTQGRVAPAKGNARLPERPRDEGGPREARPASLHHLVSQVPKQHQGRGPKAPEGLDRHRHEGQGGGHPLGVQEDRDEEGRKGGGVGRIATSAAPAAAKKAAMASKGGGEPQAKLAGVQGKGELGDHRVRLHGSRRRVLHQVKGGEKRLPFSSDLGDGQHPGQRQRLSRWLLTGRTQRTWRRRG